MKTEWQIVELDHFIGGWFAIAVSRFEIGLTSYGLICVDIEASPFTDTTFLVVAKFIRVE